MGDMKGWRRCSMRMDRVRMFELGERGGDAKVFTMF